MERDARAGDLDRLESDLERIRVATDRMGRLLEDLLVTEGYQVVLARDGSEALSVIGVSHPDLVLSDVRMPELDGFGPSAEDVDRLREQLDQMASARVE